NYDSDNPNSILNIKADLITADVSLANSKLQIKLYNGDWQQGATLIDTADDGIGTPLAGKSDEPRSSMERNQTPGDGTSKDSWHTASESQNFDMGATEKGTPHSRDETPPPDNEETPPDEEEAPPEDNNANNNEEGGTGALPGFLFRPRDVLINELVSDPGDGEQEWLELINNCGRVVDLTGWEIEDGSGAITKLAGSLEAAGDQHFKIVSKPKGNLDNKGEVIILRYDDLIIDQVAYGAWQDNNPLDNAPIATDPYSLARIQDGFDTNNDNLDWQITTTLTPGKSNVITDPISQEELAKILNEGENYSGQIVINELLSNPLGSELTGEYIELKNLSPWTIDLNNWQLMDNSQIKYTITDQDFETTLLPGQSFFILPRTKTGLALNNTGGEKVSLYQPNGRLLDSTAYEAESPKNQSWSRNEYGNWRWTSTLTPNQENIIIIPNQPPVAVMDCPEQAIVGEIINCNAGDSFDPDNNPLTYNWTFGDQSQASQQINTVHLYLKPGSYQIALTVIDNEGAAQTLEKRIKINALANPIVSIIQPTTTAKKISSSQPATSQTKKSAETAVANKNFPGKYIEPAKIRELAVGSSVITRGLVAVEPAILGKTIFYLAGSGIQIYSYYQDFPELKLGDYVQVAGIISQAGGETRIKTKSQKDIVVLEHRQPPEPHQLAIADINESTEGYLATVQGEITKISGDNVYLDDGTEEVKVYIKTETGIDKTQLTEGQTAKITGLVSQTSSGYRLLPRYPTDIELILSEPTTATVKESNLPHRPLIKYLLATAVALAIIIAGLLLKSKKAAKTSLTNQ
ncbi:MAG: lamin tail domain-containing protein, partial [bacterium]